MTVAVIPDQTDAQRMDALRLANATREWRKTERRSMTREKAVRFIEEPPVMAVSWKVADLLSRIPYVAEVKAGRMMMLAAVSPTKTLGGLTPRQRRALIDLLRS
jgi:hypothetical protein